jgi:cytochrome c oxidase cbb3-type subunit 3
MKQTVIGLFFAFSLIAGTARASDPAALMAKGKKVYSGSGGCVACHGKDGTPVVPGAPNFKDAKWQKRKTDEQLSKSIREGKGTMPKHTGPESDIPALVAYVRSFAAPRPEGGQ